jgi:hypothetical protein
MNNRNTVRANLRIRLYQVYSGVFDSIIEIPKHDRYKSNEGDKIIELFRTKIGYSKTTFDRDILHTAVMGYVRWKETGKGKPIYQSHQTVRKYKLLNS